MNYNYYIFDRHGKLIANAGSSTITSFVNLSNLILESKDVIEDEVYNICYAKINLIFWNANFSHLSPKIPIKIYRHLTIPRENLKYVE